MQVFFFIKILFAYIWYQEYTPKNFFLWSMALMQNLQKKKNWLYSKVFWKHNPEIACILIFHLHLKNINKGDYTAYGSLYQCSTSENSNYFFLI